MDWAYFVLYNRGRLESVRGTEFYSNYRHLGDEKDLIIGPIADDAMNESMNRFIQGQITDKAFLESISALDFGVQYVAKTRESCSHIRIVKERALHGKELADANRIASQKRKEGGRIAETMQKRFRREGKYFDEILDALKKTGSMNTEDSQ